MLTEFNLVHQKRPLLLLGQTLQQRDSLISVSLRLIVNLTKGGDWLAVSQTVAL